MSNLADVCLLEGDRRPVEGARSAVGPGQALDKLTSLHTERVTSVRHWNGRVFSFCTTRDPGLRFRNGQFLMLGLPVEGRPVMRAYSVVSANYEERLEFLCIEVPNGPLSPRLHRLQPGDEVLVNKKPSGTLVADLRAMLDQRGFRVSAQAGELGHYVVEKAFAEK